MKPVTTTEDLRGVTKAAIQMARQDLLETGSVTPIILLCHANGDVQKLPLPERTGALMNNGAAKDILFGLTRIYAAKVGAAGVVFATEAWYGRSTEAGNKLGDEKMRELSSELGIQGMAELGYCTCEECIIVTAQNAKECVITQQVFARLPGRMIVLKEAEEHVVPQGQFEGRQKMFGDLRAEKLR